MASEGERGCMRQLGEMADGRAEDAVIRGGGREGESFIQRDSRGSGGALDLDRSVRGPLCFWERWMDSGREKAELMFAEDAECWMHDCIIERVLKMLGK